MIILMICLTHLEHYFMYETGFWTSEVQPPQPWVFYKEKVTFRHFTERPRRVTAPQVNNIHRKRISFICAQMAKTTKIHGLPYTISKQSLRAWALARWPPPVSLMRHITRFLSPPIGFGIPVAIPVPSPDSHCEFSRIPVLCSHS